MQTLTELNGKWWYRLLKVVFALSVLGTCIGSIVGPLSEVGSSSTDALIQCNLGTRDTFFARDKGIYVPAYADYSESLAELPEATISALDNACGYTDTIIQAALKQYSEGERSPKYTISLQKNYYTYTEAMLWSFVAIAITLLAAETIRRLFYYVMLGSFRPKTHESNTPS